MKLNFWQRCMAFLIDFTAVIFIYYMIVGLTLYFYFAPFLPAFFIIWLTYYVMSLGVWKCTLGTAVFGGYLHDTNQSTVSWIKVIAREIFTSLPGIILILLLVMNSVNVSTLFWVFVAVLIILLCVTFARKRIFKLRITKTDSPGSAKFKHTQKAVLITYSFLLVAAGVSRYISTIETNKSIGRASIVKPSEDNITSRPEFFMTPRPSVHSVRKYTDYLQHNRKDINDYVFGLFEKYDHIILCERWHPEMTQHDMIYNLITDSRFTENIGTLFTEVGNVESINSYRALVDTEFADDDSLERALASFLVENQSFHLIWSYTTWHDFLKRIYYFNHGKEKKIDIRFTDRANWVYNNPDYARDSLMGANIVAAIRNDSIKKSLTIMNLRHAYLTNGNCGYYVAEAFPGRVTNILINQPTYYYGIAHIRHIHNGKWDVAFEQMPEEGYAFDMQGSPFGKDRFDHTLFLSPLTKKKYEDMFTGMIYYQPLYQHYSKSGYPYMLEGDNMDIYKERAVRLGEDFREKYYAYIGNGHVENSLLVYFGINLLDNLFFVCNYLLGIVILLYLSIRYVIYRSRKTFS